MAEGDFDAASPTATPVTAAECVERAMIYASGRSGAVDMIAAHMWFNIAAMRGSKDAASLRREVAEQMADAEIGAAQKAARDWLKAHPEPTPLSAQLQAAA
jgi:hypothetical protein